MEKNFHCYATVIWVYQYICLFVSLSFLLYIHLSAHLSSVYQSVSHTFTHNKFTGTCNKFTFNKYEQFTQTIHELISLVDWLFTWMQFVGWKHFKTILLGIMLFIYWVNLEGSKDFTLGWEYHSFSYILSWRNSTGDMHIDCALTYILQKGKQSVLICQKWNMNLDPKHINTLYLTINFAYTYLIK